MPKAILAMRTYPATLILAVLLFLATLVITTGSLGKVLGGGDGGDGGSGMGGTGKSGEFGGSGFGGTGGPSPFVTSTDDAEQQEKTPQFRIPSLSESAPVEIAQDTQTDVLETDISTVVIEAIDDNPLVEETRNTLAQHTDQADLPAIEPESVEKALQLVELQQAVDLPTQDSLQRPQNPFTGGDAEALKDAPEQQLASAPTDSEAIESGAASQGDNQQIAESIAVKLDTEQQLSEQTRDRNGIPERIQRPDLPPFQRIRPVERPALMPPRVQPMRI